MSEPRRVAMLSGKGGSGKSTIAISICKLLADMGIRVLLVDFDLATNGSSYFFRDYFKQESLGLWDIITLRDYGLHNVHELPISINEKFWFVPSRTELNRKGESYDSISYKTDALKESVLNPLLTWASRNGFAYVFFDCQAGFAISSLAASECADMAILVSEADAISSDAADNLMIQMGNSLPKSRRYLVNKIDIRDAETYRNMSNVFQSLNRLPPLPFDFSVRAAFGARRIPIDLQKPSSLLFALFETVKAAFPELSSVIEQYSKKNVDELFEEYDQKLQRLLGEKRELEDRQLRVRTYDLRERSLLVERVFPLVVTVGLMVMLTFVKPAFLEKSAFLSRFFPLILGALAFGSLLYVYFVLRRVTRTRYESEFEGESLSREIKRINEELDRYKSLLWTTSKEYLVDYEVVQASRRPSQPSAE